MQFRKIIRFVVLLMGLVSFASAQDIKVSAPSNNATVNTVFTLSASSTSCGGVATVSMGYSFDTSTNTTIVPTSFKVSAATTVGQHQLHIKCWGKNTSNVTTLTLDVVKPVTSASIPSNAIVYKQIQQLSGWRTKADPASGNGSASGKMSLVGSPSLSGESAEYQTSYRSYSGVLYSVTYAHNETGFTNFVYDAQVRIKSGSYIANLEMDNNQVIANGTTVIYGFQCAGNSGYWEYTDKENGHSHWVKSNQPCNPAKWAKDVWHHIQVVTSRDSVGNVTYHSVWFDGVEYPINKTVNADLSLGWASVLIGNFQVDGGSSSGSSTVYLDNFNIYAW